MGKQLGVKENSQDFCLPLAVTMRNAEGHFLFFLYIALTVGEIWGELNSCWESFRVFAKYLTFP